MLGIDLYYYNCDVLHKIHMNLGELESSSLLSELKSMFSCYGSARSGMVEVP